MELGRGKPHQNPSSGVGRFLGSTLGTQRIAAILPQPCGPANNSNESWEGREAWLWPTSQNRPYILYISTEALFIHSVDVYLKAICRYSEPQAFYYLNVNWPLWKTSCPTTRDEIYSSFSMVKMVNSPCLLTGWLKIMPVVGNKQQRLPEESSRLLHRSLKWGYQNVDREKQRNGKKKKRVMPFHYKMLVKNLYDKGGDKTVGGLWITAVFV